MSIAGKDLWRDGFTTVELLVAVLVISVGILGVASLINQAQVVNRRVKDKDFAYELLNKRVELIRDTPFVDVVAGDTIITVPDLQSGTVKIQVENMDSPTNHLKKITVSVHWTRYSSDSTQGETVVTYRARDGLGIRSL